MAEKQDLSAAHEESLSTHGNDTPYVVPGYGETAKREGAQTKKVFNVSFTGPTRL